MADIVDIKIRFQGETADLEGSIKRINDQLSNSRTAVRNLDAQLKLNPGNIDLLVKKYQEFQKQIDLNNQKIKSLRTEQQNLDKDDVNFETKWNKFERAIINTETQIVKLQTQQKKVTDEIDKSESEALKLEDAMEEVGKETDNAEKKAGFLGGALKVAVGNLISSGIQSATSFIKEIGGEAVNAADNLAIFEKAMSVQGYDPSTIENAKKDMQDYASNTQYSLENMLLTAQQFASQGVDDFTGMTQAVATLNTVAGGTPSTLDSISTAAVRVQGNGKLTAESWNMISEQVPTAAGLLQTALEEAGAYTGDFRTAMFNGEITAEEFNTAMLLLGETNREAATEIDTVGGAMEAFSSNIATAIGNFIVESGLQDFIIKFYEELGPKMEEAIQFVGDKIIELTEWFKQNKDIIIPLTAAVVAFTTAMTIANLIKTVTDGIKAWKAANEGATIAQLLLNSALLANPIGLVIAAIAALVAGLVIFFTKTETGRKIWEGFMTWLKNAWSSLKETAINIFNSISSKISSVATFLKTAFSEAWTKVKSIFSGVGSFFGGIWDTVKSKFSSLGTSIGTAVSDAVKSGINSVIRIVESTINGAIGIINSAIRLVNKIPGVSVGTVATISLPRLAKGGILTDDTIISTGRSLFLGGEAGPEAVIPLTPHVLDSIGEGIYRASNELNSLTNKGIEILIDEIRALRAETSKLKVYLDSDILVGSINKKVEEAIIRRLL